METEGLRRVHHRDQAAAALGEVADVERRAARRSTYPLWCWIVSGLGFAAFPASVMAGAARDVVALGGAATIVAVFVAAGRGRRVHDRCLSLGFRGWCRELAVIAPTMAVIVAAVAISNVAADWRVAVTAAAAAAAAWLLGGVLVGRVGSWTR